MAFSVTASVKSLTTLKLTSASSSAVRTSRMASRMFSSEIRPLPLSDRSAPESLSVKASNMGGNSRPEGTLAQRDGRTRKQADSKTEDMEYHWTAMVVFPCHVCTTSLSADEGQVGQL